MPLFGTGKDACFLYARTKIHPGSFPVEKSRDPKRMKKRSSVNAWRKPASKYNRVHPLRANLTDKGTWQEATEGFTILSITSTRHILPKTKHYRSQRWKQDGFTPRTWETSNANRSLYHYYTYCGHATDFAAQCTYRPKLRYASVFYFTHTLYVLVKISYDKNSSSDETNLGTLSLSGLEPLSPLVAT